MADAIRRSAEPQAGVIAKDIELQASRDAWAGALIGYIERDRRECAELVAAQLKGAGNLIAYLSRDTLDGSVVDVERVLADRKHVLSRISNVDAATGEVTKRVYPIQTRGVMSLDRPPLSPRSCGALARDHTSLHLVVSWRDGEQPTNTQARGRPWGISLRRSRCAL